MLINAKDVGTYGYPEIGQTSQKFAQNAKALIGTLRERQSEKLNKENKERNQKRGNGMSEIKKIPIDHILITGNNPRREFDEERLKELGESIREHGLLQPIMVRPKNGKFELIIGERRLRACKLIGLKEIDAKVVTIDDATIMELRLIENTQRTDLTDAEKGDAVYALLEHFSEKYSKVSDVAKAIQKPVSTVWVWANKSMRLSERIRFLIGNKQLSEKTAGYLLKYVHDTQDKLANIIVEYPLVESQAIKFLKLYDKKPNAKLVDLANEAKGVKEVAVDISKLSTRARREVESVLEEKKRTTTIARRKAVKKAREAPRKPIKIWRSPDESLRPKVAKLTEQLSGLEPEERQQLTEAVGRQIDTLTKSVDKETLEWMKKWKTEIEPKIRKETPEYYARKLEDTIYGIWSQIWVEYPQSVKETGQKQLVGSLSMERLERLQNTIRTTIKELDEFRNIVETEMFARHHKKS